MAAEITKDYSLGTMTQFEVTSPTDLAVRRFMDAQKVIDRNRVDQNDSSFNNGYTKSRDMKHVARIPILMLEIWAKQYGIPVYSKAMQEITRKKLNDPDLQWLRTGRGRI